MLVGAIDNGVKRMAERRAAGATWDTVVPRAVGSEILQRGRDAQYDRIPANRQESAEACVAVSPLTSPAHHIVPNNSE